MKFRPQWVFESTRAYRRFDSTRDSFVAKDAHEGCAQLVKTLLEKVDRRLKDQDLDGAWFCLQEAMRQEIPHLEGQALRNREQILLSELTKVDPTWRASAIEELLKQPAEDTEKDRALRLAEAQRLMDDYFQTQYYKSGLLRDHLRNLVIISFCALLTLLILIGWSGKEPAEWPEFGWKTLLMVLTFGIVGASFSATRKVSGYSGKSKIPELAANNWVTVARTVLGATPALAAYAFLKSGMLKLSDVNLPTVLAISFAAGFSERLVLNVLESLDRKGQSTEEGKSSDKVDKKGDHTKAH
jgi:hypothetical protein